MAETPDGDSINGSPVRVHQPRERTGTKVSRHQADIFDMGSDVRSTLYPAPPLNH